MLTSKTDLVLVRTCMNSTEQQTNNKTHQLSFFNLDLERISTYMYRNRKQNYIFGEGNLLII